MGLLSFLSVILWGGSPQKGPVHRKYDYLYWFQVNAGHGLDPAMADSQVTYISGPSFDPPTPTTRYCGSVGFYNCMVGFWPGDVNPATNHLLSGYHVFAYAVYSRGTL